MSGVSFIVTVYNKRPYLPAVLAAIQAQRGDFDREYVFVDDGSRDDSLEFLRTATESWPNCIIISQANAGASAAMNRAVEAATQPYLKLVDADDLLVPDATRWLLDALNETGAVLAYGMSGDYQPGQPIPWPNPPAKPERTVIGAPLRQTLRGSTLNPSRMLLARSAYLDVGGADETVLCQDYSLALPLSRLGAFVELSEVVALLPTVAPGRLTDNPANILHDVTRALGNFLQRNQDLARRDRNYAVIRAAGRAQLWSRRHGKNWMALRYLLWSLAARLNLVNDAAATILQCCAAFRPRAES